MLQLIEDIHGRLILVHDRLILELDIVITIHHITALHFCNTKFLTVKYPKYIFICKLLFN